MGTVTTVYDVELAYKVRGDAGANLNSIGAAAERAEKSTTSLTGAMGALGAAVAGLGAFHLAKEAFIGFNKEVENAKINIGAVQLMFGQAGSMEQAMKNAEGVFGRYQEAAKASTATTKEFLDMHLSLGPTFAKFGVGGKQIEDIVQGATVTAPILGERPETFAMDVKQMLQGTVTMRDRSAVSLLSMLGIDREDFNKNTKKDVNYAIDTIQKALTSPAIMAARKEMENSFAGVTSTLIDTLEILAGQAGQPLFQAITEEIKSWNEWMIKNKDTVERIKKDVGEGLVTGFRAVKSAVLFLVDHKDALLAIGGVLAALKGVQFVGAGISGIGGLAETVGKMGTAAGAASMGLSGIVSTASSVVMGLGGLYVALQGFADWLDAQHKKSAADAADSRAMEDHIRVALGSKSGNRELASGALVSQLKTEGLLTSEGALDKGRFKTFAMAHGDTEATAGLLAMQVEKAMRAGNQLVNSRIGERIAIYGPERPNTPTSAKQKKDPSINVTINRVEVASDDPDRFVMGIVRLADHAAARSGQSRSAIPQR